MRLLGTARHIVAWPVRDHACQWPIESLHRKQRAAQRDRAHVDAERGGMDLGDASLEALILLRPPDGGRRFQAW